MSKLEGSGDDTFDHSTQWALNFARDHGLSVIVPSPHQLFIDIDSDEALAVYEKNLPLVGKKYTIEDTKYSPSRSKPQGRHITVTLQETVTPHERIALQAVLGSDMHREIHSLGRLRTGEQLATMFFEDMWTEQKNEIEKLKKEVSRLKSDVSRYQYPDTTGQ